MPGIMAEKPERDFMITITRNSFLMQLAKWVCSFFVLFQLSACKPDLSDDPIPLVSFPPFVVNINLPQYQGLRTKGYVEINDIGLRGVIVYRVNSTTYITYERNCSYHPNEACATVNVDISSLFMTDPCCNSTFDLATGFPTGGPAWRPLRKYETHFSGSSSLTITDTVVE